MVASMLSDQASTFTNAPVRLGEVDITADIARSLGSEIALSNDANGTLTMQTASFATTVVPQRFAGLNRIPILMLGPLLHRTGTASDPMPGGDKIGQRPVNYHIDALEKMGAKIEFVDNYFHCTAVKLTGDFYYTSVSLGRREQKILSCPPCSAVATRRSSKMRLSSRKL